MTKLAAHIIAALLIMLICSGVIWLIFKIWQSIGGMM